MTPFIRLHPADDVVIARTQLVGGTQLENVTVRGLVPAGHKIAARALAEVRNAWREAQADRRIPQSFPARDQLVQAIEDLSAALFPGRIGSFLGAREDESEQRYTTRRNQSDRSQRETQHRHDQADRGSASIQHLKLSSFPHNTRLS